MTIPKPFLTPPPASSTIPTKSQVHGVPEGRDEASSTIDEPGRKNPRRDESHDATTGTSAKTRSKPGERKRAAALESLAQSAGKLSDMGSKDGVQGPPAKLRDVLKAMDTLNVSTSDKTKT